MADRLANETSPYLLQHLDNPVDWYPWGEEALEAARAGDRPILLSIGYSSCHWCHVMAHESFENEAIADLMNRGFVNIKVDREERPDVDAVYMEAVQAMTGHGGWPLTVFLTPDAEPFYGGTYFPPAPRGGMQGFPQVLEAISSAWRDRRDEVLESSGRLRDALRAALRSDASEADAAAGLAAGLLERAEEQMLRQADPEHGGFGRAPKFPQVAALSFLLARHRRSGDSAPLAVVRAALDGMLRGGIRDHLAGGFHRYSVDAFWTIPHFEKMLYDNAQLARLYLEAHLVTGADAYREVAEETLDYLIAEMRDPLGGFYAAQDADTTEGEGAYFSWRPAELLESLEEDEATAFAAVYGVTESGNFEEGRSILTLHRSPAEVASRMGLDEDALRDRLANARVKLLLARGRRPKPMTDTKILAAWNGLAIDAFALAGAVLGRDDYLEAAERAGRFVEERMRTDDGGLARSWTGGHVGVAAFLDDHAAVGNAFVTLYEATFEPDWLAAARRLAQEVLDRFAAPDGSGYLQSGDKHPALYLAPKDLQDGALPGGNALAAGLFQRLGKLDTDSRWDEAADSALRAGASLMARAPLAAGALLARLGDARAQAPEIAIVGRGPAADAMIRSARSRFLPGSVLAWAPSSRGSRDGAVPLLADRVAIDGLPTAYVCRQGRCSAPVTRVADLESLLHDS